MQVEYLTYWNQNIHEVAFDFYTCSIQFNSIQRDFILFCSFYRELEIRNRSFKYNFKKDLAPLQCTVLYLIQESQ